MTKEGTLGWVQRESRVGKMNQVKGVSTPILRKVNWIQRMLEIRIPI